MARRGSSSLLSLDPSIATNRTGLDSRTALRELMRSAIAVPSRMTLFIISRLALRAVGIVVPAVLDCSGLAARPTAGTSDATLRADSPIVAAVVPIAFSVESRMPGISRLAAAIVQRNAGLVRAAEGRQPVLGDAAHIALRLLEWRNAAIFLDVAGPEL